MRRDHPQSPSPNNSIDREAIEVLLAGALQAHDNGGKAAVLAFIAAHPEHAPALREALVDLESVELLQPTSVAMPERLGEFRLREPLGAGGMGIVYLAEQTSLGREVALKVVRPELLFFDGARERFRREIDAVARLEHPAIVPILATGHAEGVPYYAMPRIRGRSAEAVCRALAGRTPATLSGADLRALLQADPSEPLAADSVFVGPWWRTVVRLVHQAALGIAHAHARGVLHRDLKPSNLMLTVDGRAIVLDFGLAVARGDARLTRTGAGAGSPAFMAPEQVRGEVADERTDVYGLAATLHCLLGLQVPFAAADAEALKSQILTGARRSLPNAALPAELQLVLAQAMDVEPARRFRTASAFADDLQAVLDGRAIAARGLPMRVRLRRFAGRHHVLTTAFVALVMFVLLVPSALLWQQRQANDLLAEQVRRSDHSARVGVDTIENLLAAVARERMLYVPGSQDVAADMLRDALGRFDELAADRSQGERVAALRIRTLQRLADVEKARGRLDEALAASRRAAQLCGEGELVGEALFRRGEAKRILAGLLIDLDREDEAHALIAACRRDLMPLVKQPEWRARAMMNLAGLHGHAALMANRKEDLAAQDEALRAAIRGYADAGELIYQALEEAKLSGVLVARGQPEPALALATAALAHAADPAARGDGWPTPRHIEGGARMAGGRALRLLGRTDEAIVEQQRAVTLFGACLQDFPDEPSARQGRGVASHSLALIYMAQGRWLDARALLESACDDQRRVIERLPGIAGPQYDLGRHCRQLALCLKSLRDFAALEPLARRLGAMPGDPLLPLCGAHSLMCCAAAEQDAARTAALREEALLLWIESARRGRPLDFDDTTFAPLHADPRIGLLRPR